MDKRFELVEHTADTGLVACGDSLAEAFANAARGMFSIITDLADIREGEQRHVEVAADDLEGLLFDWLNTLLYYFDTEALLFSRFDIIKLEDKSLAAECYGEKYDPSRHKLKTGIKSATYHQLEVDRQNNRAKVIFDV